MEYLMQSPSDMATSVFNRGVGYATVGLSSVLAFAQSIDAGIVATSIGVVGLAITGVFFEFKRRRRDDMRADMEARIEMDRRALEAQITLDERKEKAYAGKLIHQVAKLQESLDEQARRVEDANGKLHELRKEQQASRLQWDSDREDFKDRLEVKAAQIARFEAENRRLMLLISGKVEGMRSDVAGNTVALDEMKAATQTPEDRPLTEAN